MSTEKAKVPLRCGCFASKAEESVRRFTAQRRTTWSRPASGDGENRNSHDDSNEFGKGSVKGRAQGKDRMPPTADCRIAAEESTAPGSARKQKNGIHQFTLGSISKGIGPGAGHPPAKERDSSKVRIYCSMNCWTRLATMCPLRLLRWMPSVWKRQPLRAATSSGLLCWMRTRKASR